MILIRGSLFKKTHCLIALYLFTHPIYCGTTRMVKQYIMLSHHKENMNMNYATIKDLDIANGPGLRVSLFVSGCTHHCKGCFNPGSWNFNYGQSFTKGTEDEILCLLKKTNLRFRDSENQRVIRVQDSFLKQDKITLFVRHE